MRWWTYQAIDPNNPLNRKIEILIPTDLVSHWLKYNKTSFYNLSTMKMVLDEPKRIYSGIREYNIGGWCYIGKPDTWYIKENITAPFQSDKVFSVYMNSTFEVFSLRADYADINDQFSPEGWENRYGRLAWKSNP